MKLQRQEPAKTNPANLPNWSLQRQCACGSRLTGGKECAECRDEPRLQRALSRSYTFKQDNEVPPIAHEVLRLSGQPLDVATRAFFEPRFGHDFSQVRVHTDARAADSARAVNALAYTVGRDIVFGGDRPAPNTAEGRRLLAHELTHVVQQDGASSHRSGNLMISRPNNAFELEAERTAVSINSGGRAAFPFPTFTGAPQLQRQPPKEEKVTVEPAGTLARYKVNKEGKILGWNMDEIAKKVFRGLSSSQNAYIRVNGYYPKGDTDFEPNVPGDVARRALIAWIGKSKIGDIESRIVTYYGSGGPYAKNVGGEIDIELAYSSLGPGAISPGPSAESAAGQEKKKTAPEAGEEEEEGRLETKVNIIPIDVSIPLEGGEKEYKQKVTLEITYQLPPIKKLAGGKANVSLGQFEVGFEGGVETGGKAGQTPKTVWVPELGVSVTVIEVKAKEQLAGIIPKGLKIGLGLGVTANFAEDKREVKGEFKLEGKNYFLKVEGSKESLEFSVGVQFDVADLFKRK